jgi:hypothetical protein
MKFTEFQRIRNFSKERNLEIESKKNFKTVLQELKIPHILDEKNIVKKLYKKK